MSASSGQPAWSQSRFETLVCVALAAFLGALAGIAAKAADLEPTAQRVVAIGVCVLAFGGLLLWRPRARPQEALGAVATVFGIAVAVVAALTTLGGIEREPALGCINTEGDIEVTVSAEAAVIFTEATAASDPKGLLIRGCRVRAQHFCVGAQHRDALQAGVYDTRWLRLSEDQGWLGMGDVAGSTPKGDPPEACTERFSVPTEVTWKSATFDRDRRLLVLLAQAPGAAFIGYALATPDGRFLRLGWDRAPANTLPTYVAAPASAARGGKVVAVACAAYLRPIPKTERTATLGAGRAPAVELPTVVQPRPAQTAAEAACDAGVPEPNDSGLGPG